MNVETDSPAGAPWVTLITGITNDTSMWDDQIPALTDSYRVLRIDSRGHVLSDSLPPPYSFKRLTDDVVGVGQKLGVKRTHVAGIGLGVGASGSIDEEEMRLPRCRGASAQINPDKTWWCSTGSAHKHGAHSQHRSI